MLEYNVKQLSPFCWFVLFLYSYLLQNNTNSPYTRYGYGELVDVNSAEQRHGRCCT